MAGNMYQLRYKSKYPVGTSVVVNGPYDTFGHVIGHKDTNKEGTLHLIRGTGRNDKQK